MNDRELLKYAAKACNDPLIVFKSGRWLNYNRMSEADARGNEYPELWNPRDDDGDSFHLAVRLRINIEHSGQRGGAKGANQVQASPRGLGHMACIEPYRENEYSATRLAILLAAAEIGKSL